MNLNLKLGPVDFRQLSTWRGLIGLATVAGIRISPALADQIALLAVTLISLIELIRNERANRPGALEPRAIRGDDADASPTRLNPAPANGIPASPSPTPSPPDPDFSPSWPDSSRESSGFNSR